MLDSIQGRLEYREPTRVLVRAGGIGFEIHVPLSTYEDLARPESDVRLLIHLVIRDDEWRLFGFLTEAERAAFRALLRVAGVGPMIALALLSGFAPGELADAVAHGDVKALTRVKGVGRKTAERIVVELRDVMARDGAEADLPGGEIDSGTARDTVAALVALGMDPADARRRTEKVAGEGAVDASVSDLVRAALRS